MLFSEIVKKAGSYSLVGKYFDDNLEVFNEYLETLRSIKEVEEGKTVTVNVKDLWK